MNPVKTIVSVLLDNYVWDSYIVDGIIPTDKREAIRNSIILKFAISNIKVSTKKISVHFRIAFQENLPNTIEKTILAEIDKQNEYQDHSN